MNRRNRRSSILRWALIIDGACATVVASLVAITAFEAASSAGASMVGAISICALSWLISFVVTAFWGAVVLAILAVVAVAILMIAAAFGSRSRSTAEGDKSKTSCGCDGTNCNCGRSSS